MEKYMFCPLCGFRLSFRKIAGKNRLFCEACGWIHYSNPLPAVGALVSDPDGRLLLIKRAVKPFKGKWCLPGGFIEIDEGIGEAAVRELKEETGLTGKPGKVIGVHIQKSRLYGSVIVIGVEVSVTRINRLKPGDDAEDAGFFRRENLPEIAFETHKRLLSEFMEYKYQTSSAAPQRKIHGTKS